MAQGQGQQNSLEQYVASRYCQDLSQSGYKPICQESADMVMGVLEGLAKAALATQHVKQALTNRRVNPQEIV